MTTTISVSEDTLKRFKSKKEEVSDDHLPELSGDAFVNSLLDTWEMVDEHGYGDTHPSSTPSEEGVAVGDLRDQLDRIESAAKEATNAAQNAERAAEEIGGGR